MSKWFRFERKLAKIFLIVFVVLLVLCVLWVQVENHVMRQRAARLISDFNKLKVNQSTGANVQEFLNPWKAQIPSWETCTEKSCTVNFSISSHIFDAIYRLRSLQGLRAPILRSYMLLSGRPAALEVWVKVYQGKLISKTLHVYLELPPDNGEEQILTGEVSSDAGIASWPNRPEIVMSQLILHSEYVVGSHTFRFNEDTGPSGGVPTLWVQSLASADYSEVEPLTHFNVNCFTGWHSCGEADLMPEAWAKFLQDSARLKNGADKYQCAAPDLQRTARDADLVAIVKITTPAKTHQAKRSMAVS